LTRVAIHAAEQTDCVSACVNLTVVCEEVRRKKKEKKEKKKKMKKGRKEEKERGREIKGVLVLFLGV